MTYLDEIAAQVRAASPRATRLAQADVEALFRLYAVLVLVKGEETTAGDVHHVWAAWKAEHDPSDADIVPFEELDAPTQKADEPFAEAIREVAARISTHRRA